MDRRDLLKLMGGGTAGLLFTPVPWRLIGGIAIRTENWPGIPAPPRGEIATRYTTCTLCPAACGVRARCVGGQPVSLAGAAAHPVSAGSLCPAGICGHHLPLLPGRLRETLGRRGRKYERVSVEQVAATIRAALEDIRSSGSAAHVALLDSRPGRTASLGYRRCLHSIPNGLYLAASPAETGRLGIDIENTRMVLSFGAPILDGWGVPGRVLEARRHLRLVQAETRQSRTALLADAWLPIRPGTEAALALGIANVLIAERLYDRGAARRASDFEEYAALAAQFPPQRAAEITGLPVEKLVAVAREFAADAPAVAIAGSDPAGGPLSEGEQIAIAALNVLAGSVGRAGGFLPRGEAPRPSGFAETDLAPETTLAEVPDGSIRVLIVDDSRSAGECSWSAIERKLASSHVVVAMAQFVAGCARQADFVLPAPAYLERVEDAPAPPDVPAAMFSLGAALVKQAPDTIEPLDFLNRVAGGGPSLEDLIKQRVAAIHASRKGEVVRYADGSRVAVAEMKSAEDLWKALEEGGCWLDREHGTGRKIPLSILSGAGESVLRAGAGRLPADERHPLALVPYGWRGTAGGVAAPIMSKLYQESGLRPGGDVIEVHPHTARQFGFDDGEAAVVETRCGSCTRTVRINDAVMPGTIQAEVGPPSSRNCPPGSVLDVCGAGADGTWRLARASLRRA